MSVCCLIGRPIHSALCHIEVYSFVNYCVCVCICVCIKNKRKKDIYLVWMKIYLLLIIYADTCFGLKFALIHKAFY